jgi:hypothetical protein
VELGKALSRNSWQRSWLAGNVASYVMGSLLRVDGGYIRSI